MGIKKKENKMEIKITKWFRPELEKKNLRKSKDMRKK